MTLMNPLPILSRVLAEGAPPGLVSLYLFGSYAEARAHLESDVDIGVLLQQEFYPSAQSRFEARVQLTAWLIETLHMNAVDVVVLNDAPPELSRHIVIQGQRLYCADRERDHAFVRDAQLRAADLAPFLRRARQVTLQALARQ